MRKPRLVLCSGVEIPQDHPLRKGRHLVELDTIASESNTHLRLENVTDAFAQHLCSRMVDLLELAAYVYTADCEADRELTWMDDKSTEQWSRTFHFVLPVRDLAFWKREDVQKALVSALNFLSSDQFSFDFVPLTRERPLQEYLSIIDVDESPFYQADRVIMFSGGLDSLAGAVESAAQGKNLVLVSHRPAPQTHRRQVRLKDEIQQRFKVPIMHIPVWVYKSGFDQESTQRTRSFLFGSLGTAVASVLHAGGVRFYENGVISLNWPLADEALRSRTSRTTHPEALQRMQCLFRLAMEDASFVIDNPFIFKTKTDIVSILGEHGAGDMIEHSCSCVHTMFQPSSQWHCGRCGQCIDRRIAILASGMGAYDSEDDYATDVFTGTRRTTYDHNIAVNYARFASELHRKSEQEIAFAYVRELNQAVRSFPNAGETAQRFLGHVRKQLHHADLPACPLALLNVLEI